MGVMGLRAPKSGGWVGVGSLPWVAWGSGHAFVLEAYVIKRGCRLSPMGRALMGWALMGWAPYIIGHCIYIYIYMYIYIIEAIFQ